MKKLRVEKPSLQGIKKKIISKKPGKEAVPTFFTIFNLICGFLAIVLIFNENYRLSAGMIFLGFIFDLLDGMLARKLGAVTELGAELDSLADAVTFVIAPALLVYFKYFTTMRIGIIVALFIVVFGILRLAKFNITKDTKNFIGMPTPFFAAIIVAFALLDIVLKEELMAILFFILAYMMISPVRYPSFKGPEWLRHKIISAVALGLFAVALLTQFNLFYFVIIEHLFVWGALLIPALFDRRFISKRYLVVFCLGLFFLSIAFYTNLEFLLVLPIIYSVIAMPLFEMAMKPSRGFLI